jgi:hypothetical protein
MSDRMPVVNVSMPAGEIEDSISVAYNAKMLNIMPRTPSLKTKLHGFLQNSARTKKVCENTSGNQRRTAFVRGCVAPRAALAEGPN